MTTEKLQKVLARAGLGSRRDLESWISAGRVTVNGQVAELGTRVGEDDKIVVDGNPVRVSFESTLGRVLVYHKPEGEICSRRDPEGRPTIFDALPGAGKGRWVVVGRLDINTSGLLLLTTDGELANRLMHPRYEIEREYAVRILGEVAPETLKALTQGVQLEDGPAKFDSVVARGGEGANQWYHVTLREGRNREVRRLWASQGLTVSRLIRVRYGSLPLPREIPAGRWKEMSAEQVNAVRAWVELPPLEAEKSSTADKLRARAENKRLRRRAPGTEVRTQREQHEERSAKAARPKHTSEPRARTRLGAAEGDAAKSHAKRHDNAGTPRRANAAAPARAKLRTTIKKGGRGR